MDFNRLFTKIPEAVVVIAPDYKILAATDYYLEVTMRKREDILGLHFLKDVYQDKELSFEDNPVRKSIQKAIDTKQVDFLDVIRYDLTRPEEEGGGFDIRYWEASHTPVLDEQGNVEYIIQHTSDVTERELARQALSESQDRFRFMAESMPQLIYTTDAQGNFTYLNKRWERYTGRPLEALFNIHLSEIMHPEDLEQATSRWKQGYQNGTAIQMEVRLRDKDGNYRWHLTRGQPMYDDKGNILMWVGSSTDIHDTRLLVQELVESNEEMSKLSDQVQQAYKQAETERKTLERLIMEAPAFFCILRGPEHRFELVNEKYQSIFPNRQLVNKTVAEALPEVVDQGYIQILDNVYQTGKEFVAEETAIQLDRNGDGQLVDEHLTFIYQPLYDEEDKITGIIVFGYIVTEQVKYRQKLRELGLKEV